MRILHYGVLVTVSSFKMESKYNVGDLQPTKLDIPEIKIQNCVATFRSDLRDSTSRISHRNCSFATSTPRSLPR